MPTTKPKGLEELFSDTLKDIYYAEKQILRALPKMAKSASSGELSEAFEKHRQETEGHVERLEQIFEAMGKPARGKTCDAIVGILEEGKEIMEDYAGDSGSGCRSCRFRAGGGALRDRALRDVANLGRRTGHEGCFEAARSDAAGRNQDRPAADEARDVRRQSKGRLSTDAGGASAISRRAALKRCPRLVHGNSRQVAGSNL